MKNNFYRKFTSVLVGTAMLFSVSASALAEIGAKPDITSASDAGTVDKNSIEYKDSEILTDEFIAEQKLNEIKTPLNLISKGPNGTDIVWVSSDPDVIASSGRVIRPRWDEDARNVTLTATIGGKITKTFECTVLPDKYLGDPMTTSDEDFFGVYKDGAWEKTGQLDYTNFPNLNKTEEAVKLGDYTKAKEELLTYMRAKAAADPKRVNVVRGPVPLFADFLAQGGSMCEAAAYFNTEAFAESDEYTKVEVVVPNPKVTPGHLRTYALISRYRDAVEVNIAGSEYPDKAMRPYLTVEVDGVEKKYEATESAVIRGGKYMSENYGDLPELIVKTQGEFVGDETYRSLLRFDFTDLKSDAKIGTVKLTVYAKKSNDYSEPKSFCIMREPDNVWKSDTVTWESIKGFYYNFDGVDGGVTWERVPGDDVEYMFQSVRFGHYANIAAEYNHTGDEKYGYAMIKTMMDFIHDKDNTYPRVLDSNLRMSKWTDIFKVIVDSKYMTPDICTGIVKRIFESITIHADDTTTVTNATTSKFNNVVKTANYFTEYTDSNRCRDVALQYFTENVSKDFMTDGAYYEDTAGYLGVAFSSYKTIKRLFYDAGQECTEEYDNIMLRAAYYDLLLRGPDGERLGYGDDTIIGKQSSNQYSEFVKWYNDPVLEYLDTKGEKGVKPDWTSRLLPDSTYVFLRNEWAPDAHMLFTNVRNGRGHGHGDDNGIILFGYGKNLLTDAGYVTYTTGDTRETAIGAIMHNTVEINGQNMLQKGEYGDDEAGKGTTNAFVANENFDFVSQTSKGYSHIGNSHTRNITYIKPDFYIVSDLLTPDDKDEVNSYKLLWHMSPESGMRIDENGNLYSEYEEPGNIIVSNADGIEPTEAVGLYTVSYGSSGEAPYAYYTKEGKGDMTFDTVLMPYDTKDAKVNAEHIDMGVPTTEATALKIDMNKDGTKNTVYYMLEYKDAEERTFGKYKTDARMAAVIEDENGKPLEFIIEDGSYIKEADGEVFIGLGEKVSDASVVVGEGNVTLTSTDDVNLKAAIVQLDDRAGIVVPIEKTSLTDISGHWAEENINKAYASDIINGYPDNTFRPDNDITRAEFLTMVSGSIGLEETDYNGEFADVKSDDWYASVIAAALKAGIISQDDNFRPNDSITREEMCKILAIALKMSEVPTDYSYSYTDNDDISDWAKEYVALVSYHQIMNGMEDGSFAPLSDATRAEAATVVVRSIG